MQRNQNAKVLQFCLGLNLKRNTSLRTDCPACFGKHTFSVSNCSGTILYYCFKNSCGIKGKHLTNLSITDIKESVKLDEPKPLFLKDTVGWTQNIEAIPSALKYLIENNCMESFKREPHKFYYDRIKDRVVFVEYTTQSSFKLATGRSLRGETPKWYKYVALPETYFKAFCQDKDQPFVIVEDCASACSVSRVANGLSLCGTSYSTYGVIQNLSKAKDVVVCLDADAKLKSLQLQRDLLGLGKFRSVKVVQAKDDLKYYDDRKDLFDLIYGEVNV